MAVATSDCEILKKNQKIEFKKWVVYCDYSNCGNGEPGLLVALPEFLGDGGKFLAQDGLPFSLVRINWGLSW